MASGHCPGSRLRFGETKQIKICHGAIFYTLFAHTCYVDVSDQIPVPNFVCNVGRRAMVNIRYVGFLVGGASLVSLGFLYSASLFISFGSRYIGSGDIYYLI